MTLPNRTNITSMHVATFKNTKLTTKVCTCYLFQYIKHKILLSLGKLCNCDMCIILNKKEILIYNNKSNKSLMKGDRSSADKMLHLHIDKKDYQL